MGWVYINGSIERVGESQYNNIITECKDEYT